MDYVKSRTTPETVTTLSYNELFVFGSNLSGRHGDGAAKIAMKFGAMYGNGNGLQGKTYAIPTKSKEIKTLSLTEIEQHVKQFILFAEENPNKKFLVTAIGCGLAGYVAEDIAPFFKRTIILENVCLPFTFWQVILDM